MVYPYNQTIGFLLQRTHYDWKDFNKFRAIGPKFEFYFSHGLAQPRYDPDWKIFYPQSQGAMKPPAGQFCASLSPIPTTLVRVRVCRRKKETKWGHEK
jgi:hypothetical protein